MTQEERFINGELLRLRREERGWVISDMALRCCMSVKQIKQLEEGGTSAFYSEAVKLTAARKAAAVLGISEHEVLERPPEVETPMVEQHNLAEPESSSKAAADQIETANQYEVAETIPEPSVQFYPKAAATPPVTEASPASNVPDAKPKTSLWTIVSLFFVALAVAAYLQPQEEDAVEAAPPLQVVPEAETAASGAETAASAASAATTEIPASAAVKPASMPVATASSASSAPVPVVVSVRTTASASAAPTVAPTASRAP